MVTLNQKGASTGLIISLIFVSLLFCGAAGFGYWAYTGRQDYKNHVDAKVQVAVSKAVATEDTKKDAQFVQDAKKPLKPYNGPAAYGSIKLYYPKNWSAYVVEVDDGSNNLDGYFYPDFVPSIMDVHSSFALRIQVVSQSTSEVLTQFSPLVSSKKTTVTPFSLPSVKGVVGSRIDGALSPTKNGSMIILPLRDKTLKVWTEAPAFAADFNNNILPNLTFSP